MRDAVSGHEFERTARPCRFKLVGCVASTSSLYDEIRLGSLGQRLAGGRAALAPREVSQPDGATVRTAIAMAKAVMIHHPISDSGLFNPAEWWRFCYCVDAEVEVGREQWPTVRIAHVHR